MKGYIYILIDPITNNIRYVGQTINIKRRYEKHLNECKKNKTYKDSWLISISKKGYKPILEIVEECERDDMNFWKEHYISLFKTWNFDLTNMTNGGEKRMPSKETCEKISSNRKGIKWSDDTKEIMKKRVPSRLGAVLSEKTKNAIKETTKKTKSAVEGKENLLNAAIKRRKKERPSYELLIEMLKTMTYKQIAEKYDTVERIVYKWKKVYEKYTKIKK